MRTFTFIFFACALAALESCTPSSNPVAPMPPLPDRSDTLFWYPLGTEGLIEAVSAPLRAFAARDTFDLTASHVRKSIQGRMERMLAFNGSIPGPVLRVKQGDTVYIRFRNRSGTPLSFLAPGSRFGPNPASIGSADPAAIADGKDSVYGLVFPEPGSYWYHDGVREDRTRALGLYGNIWVTPGDSLYWNPVHREVPLIISELKLDARGIVPFRKSMADHAVLGRFGTAFLVNGDTDYVLTVKRKEYVRFYAVNACNTRVINLVTNTHWMKVVGSEIGKYEYSQLSAGEVLGPGERVAYEVLFQDTGFVQIFHQTTERYLRLGRIHVIEDSVENALGEGLFTIDTSIGVSRDMDAFRSTFTKDPDRELLITDGKPDVAYARVADVMNEAETLDESGPGLLAKRAGPQHGPGGVQGIIWDDTTGTVNPNATTMDTRWIFRDVRTGLENAAIHWVMKRGEPILIRIKNDSNALHPMPHPIQFPGQRVLLVSVNGVRNLAMAWKDVYLVPVGATVDLVLDPVTPGDWAARCRIAEHAGDPAFRFRVE